MKITTAARNSSHPRGWETLPDPCENNIHEVNGETYSDADLMDSVMDGVCKSCGAMTYGLEPDAREYYCEACGENAVHSVLEIVLGG